MAPPIFRAESSIRQPRVLIDSQHWLENFQPSQALIGGLALLAEGASLTFALKWRGAEGPEAREFEPPAEIARQQGLVLAAMGGRGKDKREAKLQSLLEQLKDSDGTKRSKAAEALGELGDPRAIKPLIRALGDGDKLVRMAAAEALGELGDPRAVKPLIRALGDDDAWVRSDASKSLGKLKSIKKKIGSP
ncbi:MAG TPA: HEAT repeat domain-containing protein [bacterium]|nr:HEAT repeat domain-containing protein [bacterium]